MFEKFLPGDKERRRDVRTPINNVGAIRFGPAGHEMPCTVVDLTPRGAGLNVASTFGIPKVFQLAVNGEMGTRHCRVVWMQGNKLGVSFE